jgi:G2/mitotic-specific cyclin 3/4
MASLRSQPSLGALHTRRGSALGDKSNTTKAGMSHVEGKVADGKTKAMIVIKARDQIVNAQENVVPVLGAHKDAFARPAQRPSLKGASVLAPAPGKNNKQHAYTKSTTASDDPRLPTQATGKHSKLATTVIYKDTHKQDAHVDSGAIGTTRIEPSGSHVRQSSTASTLHAAAPPSRKPRHYQSHPVLKSTTTSVQQAASLLNLDLINDSLSQDVLPIESLLGEDDADTPYLDAVEELSPVNSLPESTQSDSVSLPEAVVGSETQSVVDSIDHEEVVRVAGKESPDLPDRLSDRDDDDYYEDQGYTTAHSYRYTGDQVHGGAELVEPEPSLTVTAMEAPKFTKQTIREIEEARKIVESTRSPDDIEEEAWDISMVAEYGDEIFEYMREMEVSKHPFQHTPGSSRY